MAADLQQAACLLQLSDGLPKRNQLGDLRATSATQPRESWGCQATDASCTVARGGGAAADLFELGLDGGQLLGLECEMLREQDVVDFPGL